MSTIPVFDGHNDTLLKIANLDADDDWSFFDRNDDGALDFQRAVEGGMVGGIFAMMTPPSTGDDAFRRNRITRTDDGYRKPMAPRVEHRTAHNYVDELFSLLEALESASDGRLTIATDTDEIPAGPGERLAAVAHFEGAEPIDKDLERLEAFYDRGLRSLGLVWSRPNAFGHGVPFRFPSPPDTGPGLTEAGKRLVDACGDMGIVVDLAHLNEAGFWDVADRTEQPLVVSHACCHAISPSARNLTDRQIDAVGESKGLIGINFFVGDLREDAKFDRDTPLRQLVRHIDYVADRIGIESVAFGSDFDGARISKHLGDAAGYQKVIEALRTHGYDDNALQKIARDNWLRIFDRIWN